MRSNVTYYHSDSIWERASMVISFHVLPVFGEYNVRYSVDFRFRIGRKLEKSDAAARFAASQEVHVSRSAQPCGAHYGKP